MHRSCVYAAFRPERRAQKPCDPLHVRHHTAPLNQVPMATRMIETHRLQRSTVYSPETLDRRVPFRGPD